MIQPEVPLAQPGEEPELLDEEAKDPEVGEPGLEPHVPELEPVQPELEPVQPELEPGVPELEPGVGFPVLDWIFEPAHAFNLRTCQPENNIEFL